MFFKDLAIATWIVSVLAINLIIIFDLFDVYVNSYIKIINYVECIILLAEFIALTIYVFA